MDCTFKLTQLNMLLNLARVSSKALYVIQNMVQFNKCKPFLLLMEVNIWHLAMTMQSINDGFKQIIQDYHCANNIILTFEEVILEADPVLDQFSKIYDDNNQ